MSLESTLNKYEQVIQRETRIKSKQKKHTHTHTHTKNLYPGDVSICLATNKTTKGYPCAGTTLKTTEGRHHWKFSCIRSS